MKEEDDADVTVNKSCGRETKVGDLLKSGESQKYPLMIVINIIAEYQYE